MTPEEFKLAMAKTVGKTEVKDWYGAPEDYHKAADNLMCRVLRELGYSEGVKIFLKSERWYA